MIKHVSNIGAPCAKEVFISDIYWCYCVESEIPCNTYCVNYYFFICHQHKADKIHFKVMFAIYGIFAILFIFAFVLFEYENRYKDSGNILQ